MWSTTSNKKQRTDSSSFTMADQGTVEQRPVASLFEQQQDPFATTNTNGGDSRSANNNHIAAPIISDGARLRSIDINQPHTPAQYPFNTIPLAPILHVAICNPTPQQARFVLSSSPGCKDENDFPCIFLMRQQQAPGDNFTTSDNKNDTIVERAYAILPHKKPIPLKHGDPNFHREWGRLYCGIAYKRDRSHEQQQQHQPKHDDNVITKHFRVPNLNDKAFLASATPDDPIFVAIKMIDKQAVEHVLGGNDDVVILNEDTYGENPYKEIARMQELGDNQHVIKCLEALQDDNFLYIITPWAMGGDLNDWIWNNPMARAIFDAAIMRWPPAVPPAAVRNHPPASTTAASAATLPSPRNNDAIVGTYFCKILDILAYLERFNIQHRDLSPDNFLFLDENQTVLVASDFTMSVRIPTMAVVNTTSTNSTTSSSTTRIPSQDDDDEPPQKRQRTLIKSIGQSGTEGWMAPFDGVGCDLWSAMLILYNMLTRQILYEYPHPGDISFRYFFNAGGLTCNSTKDWSIPILMDVFNQDGNPFPNNMPHAAAFGTRGVNQITLLTKAMEHIDFSDAIRELFHRSLHILPTQRWTLAQVMESSYVQQHRRRRQQHQQQSQDRNHHPCAQYGL